MTKAEMINNFSEKFNTTRKSAAEMVEYILDTVFNSAVEDGEARFGTHVFKMKVKKGKTGRNPQNGAPVEVPARIRVSYKRTKGFLEEFDAATADLAAEKAAA